MRKIKWENIFFIILASMYIYNAFNICFNAIPTLIIQLSITYIIKLAIKDIRKKGFKKIFNLEEK